MLVDGGAFNRGGVQLEERAALIVEEASFIAWYLTPMVVYYSCAIEGAIGSEGTHI
jgi:hypothetical protein